jgi:23S rRNA (cytosine1962-C5)-methyltransferase
MSHVPRITLKQGKEKPLLRGHPWVFSGAVAKIEGGISPGDMGEVYSKDGQFLGTGYVNPHSQIVFRLLGQEKLRSLDQLVRRRISRAASLREAWFKDKANAYRLVNGEGDFLPGLVVDCYGETLVLQISTAGMERLKPGLIETLVRDLHPRTIFERSDVPTRKEEGLPEKVGHLYGEEITDRVDIEEYGCRFRVDVRRGQKTGFYLDQRENRFSIREQCAGKKVLDCFCYTGAFSVHAGMGKANEITLIDSSKEALEAARQHFELNSLSPLRHEEIQGDAFEVMRALSPDYDFIILDPPPFAKKKSHVFSASRGYKDLNLHAFRLLRDDGLLLTFCCSHHISPDLFQKIVFSAAVDAKKNVQVLARLGHPLDHPVNLSHPEGEYLKGLLCRVL